MPYLDLAKLFGRDEQIVEYAKGETIFRQNEPGKTMYVVLEGEVDITLNDKVLEKVATGGIFGELALIDESPRSASAIAGTECRVTVIDERRFIFLTQATPYFALHVMSVLAERLRRQTP